MLKLLIFACLLTSCLAFFGSNQKAKQPIATPKIKIPKEQQEQAYKIWINTNEFMKETAPNFLTFEKCSEKFTNLCVAVDSIESALKIVKSGR